MLVSVIWPKARSINCKFEQCSEIVINPASLIPASLRYNVSSPVQWYAIDCNIQTETFWLGRL